MARDEVATPRDLGRGSTFATSEALDSIGTGVYICLCHELLCSLYEH